MIVSTVLAILALSYVIGVMLWIRYLMFYYEPWNGDGMFWKRKS